MTACVKHMLVAVASVMSLLLGGCAVHEWPEMPQKEPFVLKLTFDTDFDILHYPYEERSAKASDNRSAINSGTMRYIVRAYPIAAAGAAPSRDFWSDEFVFTRDIEDGYDCELSLELASGSYRLMVWADLSDSGVFPRFYNADDFAEIGFYGDHTANTDYRDAFRGTLDVAVQTSIDEHPAPSGEVAMQRPLAKFEFVTTDLREFLEKEASRASSRNADANDESSIVEEVTPTRIALEDYRIIFYYVNYMPCSYTMFDDKPRNSSQNNRFESQFSKLNDEEASLGFDYVFVNGIETERTLQIAILDKENTVLSITQPIDVPLLRNRHTIVRGSFLLSETSGGVGIDPGYDGDHNIFIP